MEIESTYKYRLINPITGTYLQVSIFDEESYKSWKPYLDAIEQWLIKQRLDKALNT